MNREEEEKKKKTVRNQSKPIVLSILCRTFANARDIASPINYVSIMEKGLFGSHAKTFTFVYPQLDDLKAMPLSLESQNGKEKL